MQTLNLNLRLKQSTVATTRHDYHSQPAHGLIMQNLFLPERDSEYIDAYNRHTI